MSKKKKIVKRIKKKTKGKPIINSKKCSQDGIEFDSKSELFCYNLLKTNNMYGLGKLEREPKSYIIVDGFEYMDSKLRPITIKPDFIDENKGIIIEIKGWATPIFGMRWKLFKRYLALNNLQYKLYVVKATQKDITQAISEIKKEHYGG